MAYSNRVTVTRKSGGGGKKKKPTVKRIDITDKMSKEKKEDFKERHGIDVRKNKAGGLIGAGATRHLEKTDPITKKKPASGPKRKVIILTEEEKKRFKKSRNLN